MELELNFANFLSTHLCPSYSKVVSLLNQTVSQWPRGAAMLTGNRGVYTIKVWDKTKGEKLIGQKVEYFYEGERSKTSIKVAIKEKPSYQRYVNPKYVTIMGFDRSPAEGITNDNIDKVMQQFGDIIVPTQDVYAENFLTGKKKLRIDLSKGKEIPRDFHMLWETPTGKPLTVSLRLYYRDQPYHCKRCTEQHVGDCPKFIAEKEEKQEVKKVKESLTKTIMVGDSNLRCVNENGVMASVTAVTGGKIGHICNQLQFENLEKIDTIVLSAGQNCTNDVEEVDQKFWEARTLAEINRTEKVIEKLMGKGKNVIILSVPPAPCTQTSPRKKEARDFVNNHLAKLIQHVNTIDTKTGMAGFLNKSDADYNQSLDFKDERHLSKLAMERRISLLDDILPENRKLKNSILKARPTCDPYRGCYGAYPAGCTFCTKLSHGEDECPTKKKHGLKRQGVSGSIITDAKAQKNTVSLHLSWIPRYS